ncbi:MAG: hypothetical protein MJ252_11915, partial [archaeon]|nr:hypothetical protein [archaeon]
MDNYKGIYYGSTSEPKIYEFGAHFRYKDLVRELENLRNQLSSSRLNSSLEAEPHIQPPRNLSRNKNFPASKIRNLTQTNFTLNQKEIPEEYKIVVQKQSQPKTNTNPHSKNHYSNYNNNSNIGISNKSNQNQNNAENYSTNPQRQINSYQHKSFKFQNMTIGEDSKRQNKNYNYKTNTFSKDHYDDYNNSVNNIVNIYNNLKFNNSRHNNNMISLKKNTSNNLLFANPFYKEGESKDNVHNCLSVPKASASMNKNTLNNMFEYTASKVGTRNKINFMDLIKAGNNTKNESNNFSPTHSNINKAVIHNFNRHSTTSLKKSPPKKIKSEKDFNNLVSYEPGTLQTKKTKPTIATNFQNYITLHQRKKEKNFLLSDSLQQNLSNNHKKSLSILNPLTNLNPVEALKRKLSANPQNVNNKSQNKSSIIRTDYNQRHKLKISNSRNNFDLGMLADFSSLPIKTVENLKYGSKEKDSNRKKINNAISVNQPKLQNYSGNSNNNIIIKPKINISFVNNINTVSPTKNIPMNSQLKNYIQNTSGNISNVKSRNKPNAFNSSVLRTNTTASYNRNMLNEYYLLHNFQKNPMKTNAGIAERHDKSQTNLINENESNVKGPNQGY